MARRVAAHHALDPPPGPEAITPLVIEAQAGDRSAFEALFRARLEPVTRYVGAIVRDPGMTEDAVAETFLQVWRDLPRLRRPERFEAWLFRIAHNRAINELNRQRPSVPLEAVRELPEADRAASPAARAEARADAEAVRAALLRLPLAQRQVLTLRYLEELSHNEIAAQLGKTSQAVRALRQRALRRLGRLVAHEQAS